MTKSLKLTQLILKTTVLAVALWATVLVSYAPTYAENHTLDESVLGSSASSTTPISSPRARTVIDKSTSPQVEVKRLCVSADVLRAKTLSNPLATPRSGLNVSTLKATPDAYRTTVLFPLMTLPVLPTQHLLAAPVALSTQSFSTKVLTPAPVFVMPTTLSTQSSAKDSNITPLNDEPTSDLTTTPIESTSATSEDKAATPTPADYSQVKVLDSVPWDAPVQKQILEDVCDGNIEKFIMLMAVAQNESRFDTAVVGDNGQSFGPFQIKANCHSARMAKYDVNIKDLHDPVKSAYVALDHLEEIKAKRDVSTMAHEVYVVYNAGHYTTNPTVSERADRVMDNYDQFMTEYNGTTNA